MPETTRTVDILVLGATVAGLTTAVEAARAGASVIVVDLAEATRFGTGLVTVAHGPRLRDVELHRGLPAVERLIAETLRGIEWLRQNLPAHGVELTPRTAYSIAVDGHLAFHLRHEARLLRRGSVTVDMTDEQPLAPLETRPPLVFADQAQVDPHRHRDALLAAARSAGVDWVGGATLGRFTPGQPWRVTFAVAGATHVVSTTHVVDTIGSAPWGGRLGGTTRVCPVVLATPGEPEVRPDLHVLVDTPAALVFTLRGHSVLVGHPVDPHDEHAAIVDLVAFTSRLGREVTSIRTRHVEESGDGLPLVGRLPVLEGAWIARGFGLSETTLATAAGVQVAAAATGGGDGTADLPWGPLRPPVGALALYRRWTGAGPDPMVDVPGVLKRRGLAR